MFVLVLSGFRLTFPLECLCWSILLYSSANLGFLVCEVIVGQGYGTLGLEEGLDNLQPIRLTGLDRGLFSAGWFG